MGLVTFSWVLLVLFAALVGVLAGIGIGLNIGVSQCRHEVAKRVRQPQLPATDHDLFTRLMHRHALKLAKERLGLSGSQELDDAEDVIVLRPYVPYQDSHRRTCPLNAEEE